MFGVADLPNGIRLRATTAHDAAFERRLHDATRQDLKLIDGEQDFIQSIVDMQFRAKSEGHGSTHPNAFYYIIEKNGDRIGRLTLDFGHNEVHVVDLTVLPAWQGQGVGSTVVQAMQNVAAKMAVPVGLTVRRDNHAAIKTYQKLGFALDPASNPLAMHMLLRWLPTAQEMPKKFIVS
ncbi:MAG: GNAT family N-acetyltransferase [Rhodospirillaceae bacterium]